MHCNHFHHIQKGNIYITFPVWSKNGLEDQQAIQKNMQQKYKQFENEVEDQLKKKQSRKQLVEKGNAFP